MGWLSREKHTKANETAGEGVPPPPPAPNPLAGQFDVPPSTVGRYGPLVTITAFDQAPIELTWQLPIGGELYRLVPGPDRPDYSVMVLERPLHFYPTEGFDVGRAPADRRVPDRRGRPMVRVEALVVCARFVGQQLHPGMRDLAVNVAYVIDDRVLTDERLDLAMVEYAAVGLLSEGRPVPATAPSGAPGARPTDEQIVPAAPAAAAPAAAAGPAAPPPRPDQGPVVEDVARILRDGVAAQRGAAVGHLRATLTLDESGHLAGLNGVADGAAPVPTRETFDRINAVLGSLRSRDADPVEAIAVTVEGDDVSCSVRRRGPLGPV